MIKIFRNLTHWRQFRKTLPKNTHLGFVPTLGNLHAGHASLLQQAKIENEKTLLSIFINPTQFNNTQDLQQYPKTLDADIQLAESEKVDYVLMPSYDEIYPDQYRYKINESEFSLMLEGEFRPGHFDGVLTVVMKLLQLAQAKRAYFGEKDYQQLQLVRGLTQAFFLETEIIACPTIRDKNGLALSSRNQRLSPAAYEKALLLPKLLSSNKTCEEIIAELSAAQIKVEYVMDREDRRLAAIEINGVRLIDNVIIGVIAH